MRQINKSARIRRWGAALGVTLGSLVLSGAAADVAGAWAWSSHVDLNGSIQCPSWGGPYDKVQWAWLQGNTGDYGWVSLSGTGRVRSYSFHLSNVPTSSEQITIRYGCSASGTRSTTFGVARPAYGTNATRNIY